jgi:CHAT domain-containing protein
LPLARRAVELRAQVLGKEHWRYALSLFNLGAQYDALGQPAQAEPLYRQALEIRKQALGERHPQYATSLHNLGQLYQDQGNYAQAEPLYKQALEIYKQALGERHPLDANSLNSLARLYQSQQDYARAEPIHRQALEITHHNLDLAALEQSERRQLAMTEHLRSVLDGYLSFTTDVRLSPKSAFGYVLAWKGATWVRQAQLRRAARDPQLAPLAADLRTTATRLAALALGSAGLKDPDERRRQLTELTLRKEQLEADLARQSVAFRRVQEQAALAPEQLQRLLPAGTALVDLLEYRHFSPPPRGKGKWQVERRLAAFVLRPDVALIRLELGPSVPIAVAVEQWRSTWGKGEAPEGKTDPASTLRRLVWQPLEPHLKDVRTVLVSPDGALLRFPFAALPGSKPNTYLIEEIAMATVAVPQMLPAWLVPAEPAGDTPPNDAAPPPSLLVVGDVDFGAAPGAAPAEVASRAAVRGGALPAYAPLPGTRGEVLAVRDSFERRFPDGTVRLLRGEQATEAALRREAPRHLYLHLATHGFFAPAGVLSALAPDPDWERRAATNLREPELFGRQGVVGYHPGLLSGVVLAGANRPAAPDQDDGILTALEVAELDLRGVELVTLSACETGLGAQVGGGEGLLGLQRAFQVAGARTVVAGLWQVPDQQTRELMDHFYENLWHKKLTRLEALRQAQLWLLKEGPKRGPGKERPVDPKQVAEAKPEPAAGAGRAPPFYWAAFVLSGDWR